MRFSCLLFLLVFVSSISAVAQSGVIRGRVYNKVNNQPVPFAAMVLQGTQDGVSADGEGYYRFEKLEPGQYNIEVTSVGFRKRVVFEIQVTNARPAVVDIAMEEEAQELQVVEVNASNTFVQSEESPVSLRSIGSTEIKRTPGGNRDISKVIRSLPGVSSPPSFRNDIIIRGGAPSENVFYLDGIQIPVINHFQTQGSSGGPVGMINVDLLREVDFYSGAFPANRGNALSSVFDFQLKDPRRDKWTMNGVVGATDLGLTFEGPVTENSSLVFSVRRSYLKFLFSIFNLPFLPVYNDAQFKYSVRLGENDRLTFLGIGAIDDFSLNFDAPEKADTPEERDEAAYTLRALPVTTQWNYTVGAKYEHFRANGTTTVVFSTNRLNNDVIKYRDNDESTPANLVQDYRSKETEYKFRLEDNGASGRFKYSYGVSGERAVYDTREFSRVVTQQGPQLRDYSSRLALLKWGAFAQSSIGLAKEKVTISAGVRADANNYSADMSNLLDQLSPRISASWRMTPALSLNFNTGVYYQLPAYTVLGYREGDILVNKNNDVKYIKSEHMVAGVEVNLKRNARITVEGFYKNYSQYPFQLDDSVSLANLGADFGTIGNAPVSSSSDGRSYGGEFLLQQKLFRGYYGLLAYTWVRSEFEDRTGNLVPSSWDNRHLISLTGGKRFARNWELGLRFLLSGGSPYTPYNVNETLRRDNWDIRPFAIPDYNRLNSMRIGSYHQLDLRIDKKYFFPKWSLDVYLDVQNVYGFSARFQDVIDVQRDAEGTPIEDPAMPGFYAPKYIPSTYGTILPTIGLIVEL